MTATERNAIWHHVVNATAQVLHAHPTIGQLSALDRQQIALSIGHAVMERVDAAQVRRWTGTRGEPCWTCDRPEAEHRDGLCPVPTATARTKLDAFIAAFDALGVRSADVRSFDMVDRVDHSVAIGVHSATEVVALAAELDMPAPNRRVAHGYAWVESAVRPDRGVSIVIQGAHKSARDTAA